MIGIELTFVSGSTAQPASPAAMLTAIEITNLRP
jgi:hypothetical protein